MKDYIPSLSNALAGLIDLSVIANHKVTDRNILVPERFLLIRLNKFFRGRSVPVVLVPCQLKVHLFTTPK